MCTPANMPLPVSITEYTSDLSQAAIYNGRAVCYMKAGDYEEAERDLLEAFNKDAKNADTLANLITCGLHLGKNVQRYIT